MEGPVDRLEAHRAEVWRRWRDGQSLSQIGRALDRNRATIHQTIAEHGGITPRKRTRAPGTLSFTEREEISRGLAAGDSIRSIAHRLDRAPSTVSREISRNGGATRYRAAAADRAAWERAKRPKPCRLTENGRLRAAVTAKLKAKWSPEQISAWLRKRYPRDRRMHVSHETIYRTLFVQARGTLRKELTQYLRTRRTMRRANNATHRGEPRGAIVGAISISERPPEADDRAVPGHWEGDLIAGSRNTYIATLVERATRYVMLVKVESKASEEVAGALSRHVRRLPEELRRSLTWDRGKEMARHANFSIATDVPVYFCDPRSPWQRGSNENTNGLLRQYFPKGTDLSVHSQAHLNRVARELNGRPRKTLDWDCPAEVLERVLR